MATHTRKKILLLGSLAYDRIMDYPGRFSDHILPEKIHSLSIAFPIENLEECFGGTAGNVAYNLSMLGQKSIIIGSGGKDFDSYTKRLKKLKITSELIKKDARLPTMVTYIMTDKMNNQITGFYKGALAKAAFPGIKILRNIKNDISLAVVSPSNTDDMASAFRDLPRLGIEYILDVGQAMPYLTTKEISLGIKNATALTANDYELSLIIKKTRLSKEKISRKVRVLITTLGEKGSELIEEGKKYHIPAMKLKKVVDPTGAGDAYRAGLVFGLSQGYNWIESARIASIVSSYPVQFYGTQEHKFNFKLIKEKYKKVFKESL